MDKNTISTLYDQTHFRYAYNIFQKFNWNLEESAWEEQAENWFLVAKALESKAKAYVPYSKFEVGAALLTDDNQIYSGCNIESCSYTPTNCAERTAFFKAVSEEKRSFSKIAIVGGYPEKDLDICPPCGVCRQVMMEFCAPKTFEILLWSNKKPSLITCYTLEQLMPLGFGPKNL